MSTRIPIAAALTAALAVGAGGAGSGPKRLPCARERVTLDPGRLSTRITNPYLPLRTGSRWVYRETNPDGARQRVAVTVTGRTRRIANGVLARVVHDRVTERGELIEETFNWYAQDERGNVWDLGEDNREYENGRVVSRAGSFEAGVAGAQPSVLMPARPRRGLCFRIEAGDRARVFSLGEQVEVPYGHFRRGRVLMVKETSPEEPKSLGYKFYARRVGMVLAIGISDGSDREELVRYTGR